MGCVLDAEATVRLRLTTLSPAAMAGRMTMLICRLCVVAAIHTSQLWKGTRLRQGYVLDVLDQRAGTQEGLEMSIEEGDNALNRIIDTTRAAMKQYRAAGVTDEQFIVRLVTEFSEMRKQMSPEAGSLHMALSCYRMALMCDYIQELEEKVAFHKAAVEFLLELDEFESI